MSLVKIINLPQVDKKFKVVQLSHNSDFILLCGSTQDLANHRHYKILRGYLRENEVEFDPHNMEGRLRRTMPALETKNKYKVLGMGYMSIDIPNKTFESPFGASSNYEIPIDPQFNEEIQRIITNLFENPEKYGKIIQQ
jgi:hypothetical protein